VQTTSQLINDILNGNNNAFESVVKQHGDNVYNLCNKILQNNEDAKDVTQETFIKVFQNLKKFKGDSSFTTWIHKIAYNNTISFIRKNKNYHNTDIESITDDDAIEDEHDTDIYNDATVDSLQKALQLISPDERAIVTLFYSQNYTLNDIANVMNISVTNAKTKLHRIRKKLQQLINKIEQES
jgi:RNA polymerase sigma-70 factor (ECF subfamily)